MKRTILALLVVLVPFCIVAWGSGQKIDDAACTKLLQGNCTECHSTARICGELGQEYVDWPSLVSDMGERAKLNEEQKEVVLDCLTKAEEPGTFVCSKK